MGALAASSFALGGANLLSAVTEAEALERQGKFQRAISYSNAEMAELQADDAIRRGDKASAQYRSQVKKTIGSQRASLAAQGIDVDTGSAEEVQSETKAIGEMNMLTIKNNAWREAFGFKSEAQELRLRGDMARLTGERASIGTLITGGLTAAGNFAKGGYYMKRKE